MTLSLVKVLPCMLCFSSLCYNVAVNAADNKQRDSTMSCIKVDIVP